jgi:hypothetical protein
LHGQHSSGQSARQLTPEELAERAKRVARREERAQRVAERVDRQSDPDRPQGFLVRHGDQVLAAFIGFLGLVILAIGCILLPPAISAAQGHGVRGVFVAEQYVTSTNRYGQSGFWVGSFTAANHSVEANNVDYNDPPFPVRAGSKLSALYPGGDEVFAPHGSSAWLGLLVLTLAGAAFFGGWVWYMPLGSWRRRRRQRKQATADPLRALLR